MCMTNPKRVEGKKFVYAYKVVYVNDNGKFLGIFYEKPINVEVGKWRKAKRLKGEDVEDVSVSWDDNLVGKFSAFKSLEDGSLIKRILDNCHLPTKLFKVKLRGNILKGESNLCSVNDNTYAGEEVKLLKEVPC